MAQIYRVGKDIFDASTNQKIANPNVLATQYKGATEIQAPNLNVPTGATKILNPAGLQGLNESQLYRQGAGIYKLPSAISSDMITGSTAPTIKAVDTPLSTTDAFIKGIGATTDAASLYKAQEAQRAAEIAKKDAYTNRVDELIAKKGTKGAALTAQENLLGAPEQEKALAEAKSIMSGIETSYNANRQAQEGRKGLAGSIYGRQALMDKKYAVEYGNAATVVNTLQGNLTAAKDSAKKTIDAEYESVENELEAKLQQLSNAYNDLSSADKKRADELSLVLGKQKDDIAAAKEEKNNIADVMIAVGKAGNATPEIMKQILNSGSYSAAASLAAPYLKDSTEGTWQESGVKDKDGNPMLFNNVTGEYKTATGTTINNSTNSYTDGAGNTWSLAGWATDTTKASQMQSIANKIGKVDDSNIEEKVKQFTPGVTADMIKEASAQSGVSWEAIMTQLAQESLGGTSNVAKNNNNFGGLTWSANTQWQQPPYNGTIGTARPEGGNYIKFPTKQAGLNALAALQAQYGKVEGTPDNVSRTDQQAIDIFNGNGSLSKVSTKDYPAVSKKLGELKAEALSSGDIEGVMRASAGGKDVDATTVTSFEKAFNVIGQLDDLKTSINKEATGPITGIIRSNNPYDAKAALIKAQLTAIVPNLARGIYGEVGVLTDNDVKLYSETLPNLKSTEEIQKLILASTVRSVQRSIENKIKVQAGLGRDVSGLVNQYKDIKATADSLEGGSVGQIAETPEKSWYNSPEGKAAIQQATGNTTETNQGGSSVWNSIRSWFGLSPVESFTDKMKSIQK